MPGLGFQRSQYYTPSSRAENSELFVPEPGVSVGMMQFVPDPQEALAEAIDGALYSTAREFQQNGWDPYTSETY